MLKPNKPYKSKTNSISDNILLKGFTNIYKILKSKRQKPPYYIFLS